MEEQFDQLVSLYCSCDTANHALADELLQGMPDLKKAFFRHMDNEYGWCKGFLSEDHWWETNYLWFAKPNLVIDFNIKWGKLPPNIKKLEVRKDFGITQLPDLPATLETLIVINNKLAVLPKLPVGLKTLICVHNQLKQLPELPEELDWLDCSKNPLIALPKLPDSLLDLIISKEQKGILPKSLPNLLFVSTYVGN